MTPRRDSASRRIARQSGRRAEQLYEERRAAWIKRHRRLFLIVNAGATAIVLVALAIGLLAPVRWVVWISGLAAGLAIAFAVILRLSPPPWIEHYQIGAIGERQTGEVLGKLPSEHWTVLTDLHHRTTGFQINFDHVVVGPPGVFLIDTKKFDGTVQVVGDQVSLTRPGEDRPTGSYNLSAKLRGQCRDMNALLRKRTELSPWVNGVIAIWGEFPQKSADGNNVHYLHGDQLVAWLQAQPERLTAGKIQMLTAALQPGRRRADG